MEYLKFNLCGLTAAGLLSMAPIHLNLPDISKPLAKPPAPQNRSIKLIVLFGMIFKIFSCFVIVVLTFVICY